MSKLAERRKRYGIPPIPYLPMGKVVLVYRVPNEEKSAGGLLLPQVWTEKIADGMGNVTETTGAKLPDAKGVLVGAGLQALDIMREYLIEMGDIVWFGKYAGYEAEVKRDPTNAGRAILQLKVDELLGSVDALERFGVTHTLAFDDKEGEHYYEEKRSNGHGNRGHRKPAGARGD